MSEPTKETLDEWHKDPKNWKWGIFYYNKKDKRLFPPKKIKALGWTVIGILFAKIPFQQLTQIGSYEMCSIIIV